MGRKFDFPSVPWTHWKVWDDLGPLSGDFSFLDGKESWCPGLWHPWDADFGKQALNMSSSWRGSSAWVPWVKAIQHLTRQISPVSFPFSQALFQTADFSQHSSTLLLEEIPDNDFCWHRWQTSQISCGGTVRNPLYCYSPLFHPLGVLI